MPMIPESLSRKERRKAERKKRKRHHVTGHKTTVEEQFDQETEERQEKRKKTKKYPKETEPSKKLKEKKYEYTGVDPDVAAAIQRDDDEIAELETKLGIKTGKKGRDKLNKEYAKLEGYGDDFGDFLEDLDNMVERVTKGKNSRDDMGHQDDNSEYSSDNEAPLLVVQEGHVADVDPDIAAALQRDDEEIADLEQKLGFRKEKDKAKLYKEYAKLEGYGEDFGEFLEDLDDMVERVSNQRFDTDYSKKQRKHRVNDTSEEVDESEDSDAEELVPMKEPFEAMDEDDSVLDELEYGGSEQFLQDGAVQSSSHQANGNDDDSESAAIAEGESADDAPQQMLQNHDSDSASDASGSSAEEDENEADHDVADTYRPTQGEDIYGNKIDGENGDGTAPSKYVPPHLRMKQGEMDGDQEERKRIIRRGLNNALNRLSDDTLVSVAQQVSKLYSSHPNQIVHDMLWKNTKDSCVAPPILMIGLIPAYMACIIGVHIQTGDTVQVGEYILEQVTTELFSSLEQARQQMAHEGDTEEIENKRICNLVLLMCYMYNYSIVHCSFMYDIVRHLIEKFSEIDIECLLLLLGHCGRSLRSDDPMALKEIVLLVQKKKASTSELSSSSRAEYMVSAIMDLKNNKRRKQDSLHVEKTMKLRKLLGRIKSSAARSNMSKTSSEALLRISLQDILQAETKGRWWKVGASWVGNQYRFTENESHQDESKKAKLVAEEPEENEELFRLATKFRMNTDRKRSVFCIIMGGADCDDAFEKLCRSSMLQNRSERDTVRVLIECCGNEKAYNKFYGHLAARICEYQPQCRFSFQLAFWDTFKRFDSMDARKSANLAKLLFHLVVTHHLLKLMTVLRAIEISQDEMEESAMIFLTILLSSILEHYDDPSKVKSHFETYHGRDIDPSKLEQDEGVKSALLVFFLETLKGSPKNKSGTRFRKNFKAAVKVLDTDGFESMF